MIAIFQIDHYLLVETEEIEKIEGKLKLKLLNII